MKIHKTVSVLALALTGLVTGAAAQQTSAEVSTSVEARVESRAAERDERSARGGSSARAAADSEARLVLSREALEGDEVRSVTAAEVEAGARALAAGAERADLEHVRERAPSDRNLVASLDVLATLSARGFSSSQAAAIVATQLARGASDEAIARFGSAARTESMLEASGATAALGGSLSGSLGGSLGSVLGARAGLIGSVGGRLRL